MNKKNRFLSLLLSVIMILEILPISAMAENVPQSGSCGENLTWSLDLATGVLSIEGSGEMDDYHQIYSWSEKAPWYYYREAICSVSIGSEVTSLGSDAFFNCINLCNITIPRNITKMGYAVFSGCNSLKTAGPIGGGYNLEYWWVDAIPNYAFRECYGLTSVKLPDTLTSIGMDAFLGCVSLSEITIPDSVNLIGIAAFASCSSLKSINIPNGVSTIYGSTFQYSGITSIDFPKSLQYIQMDAFAHCDALTQIVIPENVKEVSGYAFDCCTNLSKVKILGEETKVWYSFCRCDNLTSAGPLGGGYDYEFAWSEYLPEGIFGGCGGLQHVVIPSTVKSLGGSLFGGTGGGGKALKTAGPIGGGYDYEFGWTTEIPDYAFKDLRNLTDITLPTTATSIGEEAFSWCISLESIVLPDTLYNIGEGAFANCTSLTRISFPDNLTQISAAVCASCTSLEEVSLPTNIQSIERLAFSYCSSLSDIIFPKSLSYIGKAAFTKCTSLSNVFFRGNAPLIGGAKSDYEASFPENTTLYYIDGMTGWIDNEKYYDIESKTWCGYMLETWSGIYDDGSLQLLSRSPENNGVFSGDALTVSMTFNHEVESVQTGFAFDEAGQIVSYGNFSIVREIEEADSWKFETVYSLSEGNHKDTDVTIDGCTVTINASSALLVPGETYYVLMDNGVISFKDTDERIGFSGKEWGFTAVDGIKSGTFRYKAQYGKTEYPYYFDESWFQKPSTEYNHELAKMSLRASIAAYGSGSNEDGSEYIQELMGEKLGFQNLEVHYPTPQRHSIGYAIGSKTIASEESASGAKSLIMVAIRGGEYKAEWAGNFMVGDTDVGDLHEGFLRAAEQVEDGLRNYIGINQESLNDECVVWIVGYSRAAASANLLAKKLDDGSIEGVGTNNVFAYCFECPQNSRASNLSASKYDNIMNIVNPLDPVAMVVPTDWGYGRYGQTFFLPYVEGVTNYNQLKDKMIAQYSSIIQAGSKSGSAYDATYQVAGQRDITDGFINHWLANEFKSPEYYVYSLWQAEIMDVVERCNLDDKDVDDWASIVASISRMFDKLGINIAYGVFDTLADLFDAYDNPKESIKYLIAQLDKKENNTKALLAISLLVGGTIESGDIMKTPIFYTHWPELCMAWMDSLTGDQIVRIDNTYRRVLVNCPVDVSVYDSEDTLVGQVIDRNVQEIEDGVSIYIDENEQIVISLPITEEYRVEMDATGEGTVTYTVTEYNIETSAEERVISYAFVEVETNDVLVGQIENLKEVDSAEYSLTYNGELLIPSVDQSDDAVERYTVMTAVEGDGSTNGGGKAVYGEYRKLTATPDDGTEFIGWFVDGEQVSEELEYRFCVTGDITVTAKFTLSKTDTGDHETVRPVGPAPVTPAEPELPDEPVLPENPFTDVHENDFFYDAVIWAVNNGITSGSGADTFAPDRACTRAEMVTFLWRAAGTPEPVSGNNPFTDVTETDYFYKAVLWAVENGITKGTSETTFSPNDTCTRGQTVTFLYRYAGAPEVAVGNPFADVQENNYYYHAVIWAVAEEITKGTGETTFSPNNFCTRSQIVTFLYRYSTK